ncbi:SEC-C domain-containing protein [Burkholderia cenocepacia]|uniref:SEC-C metal-binding domain-containing protein n=1 Tax=Burkholderia cepacia complex TaxID=87882 RepID=UPI00158BD4E2|nr:SEC-C metal-binding domain-containing protein [Burkholderia cenocepacia]MBJ9668997.1 SEC-C domain-containing protein [Burkholderia cenocepacia]
MARIPAICDSCGKTFPSDIALEGSGHSNQFIGFKFKCPYCGGMGTVASGTYDHENGVISLVKVFTSPGMTADRIAQIQQVLEDARRADSSVDDVKARLEGIGEGFSALLDIANRSSGLAAWIGAAATVAALLYQIASSNGQVTESDVRHIMREQEQQQMVPSAPPQTSLGARAFKLRAAQVDGVQSQGSPCACGSGKKYKHCHGKKRWQV